MNEKDKSKLRLPMSFWAVYVDICLRHWLVEEAKRRSAGGAQYERPGADASPKPPLDRGALDSA